MYVTAQVNCKSHNRESFLQESPLQLADFIVRFELVLLIPMAFVCIMSSKINFIGERLETSKPTGNGACGVRQ